MEKELGSEIIKTTQTSLGKYVKRPPLSEKLLSKPPFRFLHDIVTSVLKTNKFFEGLFEEEELISDNVKDRESKITFLNKVISVLALTTGKSLTVKPSKIVAGQEPEKTNELLQCLAYALDNKLSSDEAVKKFKDTSKPSSTSELKPKGKEVQPSKTKPKDKESNQQNNTDSKKLTSRSSEKLTAKRETGAVSKNDKSKTVDIKSKRKESSNKNDPPAKKTQNLKAVGKKTSIESISSIVPQTHSDVPPVQQENSEKDNVTESFVPVQNLEIKSSSETVNLSLTKPIADVDNTVDINTETNIETQEKLNSSYTIAENDLNSSSSQDLIDVKPGKVDDSVKNDDTASDENKSQDLISNTQSVEEVETDESKVSFRKSRPPLVPKHSSEERARELENISIISDNSSVISTSTRQSSAVVRPASVRPSSSRPGAPRPREKIDNIIPETENLILGKVNIITENAQNDEEDTSVIIVEQHTESENEEHQEALLSSSEHGHLVQQILDSQKELSQGAGKTEIEWQVGARRAKEASNQELEQLRYNIQALSRIANPLGKLLDHIQEDVEVMRQELVQWTKAYEDVSRDILKERAATEETLVPLQTRVRQLDGDMKEKRDKINDIKIIIHKNTARIDKLLANGNVQ